MKRLLVALLFAALPFTAIPPAHAASPDNESNAADARFKAIYEKEWKWREQQGGGADEDGDNSGAKKTLPKVDAVTQAARLKVWDGVLADLDKVDVKALSPKEQINYAVYRPQVENLAAEIRFGAYEAPFNADSSFWSNLGFMTRRPLKSADDYHAYAARLADVPRYFNDQITNMRAGLKRGFSVPRAVLDGRDVSIAAVADDGFRGAMGALLVAIEDDAEPANGAADNLHSLALAFAAIHARRTGRPLLAVASEVIDGTLDPSTLPTN